MTTATYPLTLPADAGTAGQFLTTNGLDTISWSTNDSKSLQTVFMYTGAPASGATTIPIDNTKPQNTEGDQYMTLSITPSSSSNLLKITVITLWSSGTINAGTVALFQDSNVDAIASSGPLTGDSTTSFMRCGYFTWNMTAGTTSSTTFNVRIGNTSGNVLFNASTGPTRVFGGVANSGMIIREYAP